MPLNKKRTIIIASAAALLIAAASVAWNFFLRDFFIVPGIVDVEQVSVITGLDGGIADRFAGIVEPQDTFLLRVEPGRKLKETLVAQGDEVHEGAPLIEYETEELELEQKKLNILRINNTISSYKTQIETLTKQRTGASAALQLEYTQQIQSYEANVKQEEYNKKVMELDIDKLEKKISDSVILSPFDGVVQSINEAMVFGGDAASPPYIVVNALGGYRVRAEINELNIDRLEIGAQVFIKSRTDDTVWHGEISKIDLLSPITGRLDSYAFDSNPVTLQSTRYPFYVTVIDNEGLILGRHVYIEPNIAKMARNGLWLLMHYIQVDSTGPFVWAANTETDKLERRYITLGDYDPDNLLYEILSGLKPEDEIAWPSPEFKSGMNLRRGSFAPPQIQPERAPLPSDAADESDEQGSPDTTGSPAPQETSTADETNAPDETDIPAPPPTNSGDFAPSPSPLGADAPEDGEGEIVDIPE